MVGLAENWVLYAIVAMALFSIGNLTLKLAVDSTDFTKIRLDSLTPLLLVLAAAAVVLFTSFASQGVFGGEVFKYVTVFAAVSVLGFLALVEALKFGKIAVVNAVLALSVVFVTGLSAVFLGEKITAKEMGAMALAVASIFLLAS